MDIDQKPKLLMHDARERKPLNLLRIPLKKMQSSEQNGPKLIKHPPPSAVRTPRIISLPKQAIESPKLLETSASKSLLPKLIDLRTVLKPAGNSDRTAPQLIQTNVLDKTHTKTVPKLIRLPLLSVPKTKLLDFPDDKRKQIIDIRTETPSPPVKLLSLPSSPEHKLIKTPQVVNMRER